MIVLRLGSAEDGENRVARKLHDRAPVLQDRAAHPSAMLVQLSSQSRRVRLLCDPAVAADVGHEDRDDELRGLANSGTVVSQPLGDPAWKKAAQRFTLLLPLDDRLVEQPKEPERLLGAC